VWLCVGECGLVLVLVCVIFVVTKGVFGGECGCGCLCVCGSVYV
jgi:hypothetical protein